ncbi:MULTISPECIES: zincin-like metallopeptidase domain-containing protein [Thalassospira]|uniref:zincin-like metallopeptidase domain-containing protein n=1 Tax=Thalassospira TaxID=168934 RepID=UPI000B2507F3|nr:MULTISPECIES: zincin-like metallopeptidase domain-containing protein [Thalassospira]
MVVPGAVDTRTAAPVPPPQSYFDPINWHRTALHECLHATGHKTRLNRDQSGSFRSKKYAFEELVAKMSAAFLRII